MTRKTIKNADGPRSGRNKNTIKQQAFIQQKKQVTTHLSALADFSEQIVI
jgi:hypothetical protein